MLIQYVHGAVHMHIADADLHASMYGYVVMRTMQLDLLFDLSHPE